MSKSFGLQIENLSEIEKYLTAALSTKEKWQVDVFGSRQRGDFKKYSDLDLWIESVPPFSRNELDQLREKFEDSNLPIKIDLVTPETVTEEYRTNIISEKSSWLCKSL